MGRAESQLVQNLSLLKLDEDKSKEDLGLC